jgi:hypothetical protein
VKLIEPSGSARKSKTEKLFPPTCRSGALTKPGLGWQR